MSLQQKSMSYPCHVPKKTGTKTLRTLSSSIRFFLWRSIWRSLAMPIWTCAEAFRTLGFLTISVLHENQNPLHGNTLNSKKHLLGWWSLHSWPMHTICVNIVRCVHVYIYIHMTSYNCNKNYRVESNETPWTMIFCDNFPIIHQPLSSGSALKPWFSESRPWQRPWPQELWGASGLSGLWAAGILVMIIGMAMAIKCHKWWMNHILYLTLFNHVINQKKAGEYHNYNIISVIRSCCQNIPQISPKDYNSLTWQLKILKDHWVAAWRSMSQRNP